MACGPALDSDEFHVRDEAGQPLAGLLEGQDPVRVALDDEDRDVDLRQAAGLAEGAAGFAGVADECGDRIAAREQAADDLAADAAGGADHRGGHRGGHRGSRHRHVALTA
jgi:hypothetical protein